MVPPENARPDRTSVGSEHWNSLGAALTALFPDGTAKNDPHWHTMPWAPTDVFAAAAYLLDRGGAYHRLVPEASKMMTPPTVPKVGPPFEWSSLNLSLHSETIAEWQSLGRRWWQASIDCRHLSGSHLSESDAGDRSRTLDDLAAMQKLRTVMDQVGKYWTELVSHSQDSIVKRPPDLLGWWRPAAALLIMSDEACRDLGYRLGDTELYHPLEEMLRSQTSKRDEFLNIEALHPRHKLNGLRFGTFTFYVNQTVARVVPKSRTPTLGCTMRTLSHHIAMVPPQGVVDVNWYREPGDSWTTHECLNIVAVPFPFNIAANCFTPVAEVAEKPAPPAKAWGWFHVSQRWLEKSGRRPDDGSPNDDNSRNNVRDFILALLKRGSIECGRVHGLLLPEMSLDWLTYCLLVDAICDRALGDYGSSLEFLIAGSASNHENSRGNFVLTTTFSTNGNGDIQAITFCRAKHHRWQLDGSQISEYALASALDPTRNWREGNELPRREIGLTVVRRNSMFTTMVCEDLARSEPVHEPLRSVGPNIVFVLLMDGPQLPERWSARYATALADDPGSSVLTLTSLGLIRRSNLTGRYPWKNEIGIWKEDTGKSVTIKCPSGSHAIVITLSAETTSETTFDGRTDADTRAWRYSGHQPIGLPPQSIKRDFDWIISGDSA
jgi:hypothetical protein